MSFKYKDSDQAALRDLWGGNVPPLTPQEIELSVKVWQKIKARKQREQKSEPRAIAR